MARDEITVINPILDNSESIASVEVTKQAVTQENGITIKNAFENKNNTLFIEIENTAEADSSVTFKAGNAYPNSMLGDLTVTLKQQANTLLQIQDPSRFEKADGSIDIDFKAEFTGNIYAFAKRAGLRPVK